MNKIEQLLAHARADEAQKFKDVFNSLRNSLNVWDEKGGTHSEAMAFISGNLIERYTDLLTVVDCYWKTHLTEDTLKSPSSDYLNTILKTLPPVIGSVAQNYGWDEVLEVCAVFLNAPATESPIPQKVVTKLLIEALGKLRTTPWLDDLETLKKVVEVGKISEEAIVVTSVKNGNDQLLLAHVKLNSIQPLEAIYVASMWSEKLAEIMPVVNSGDTDKFVGGKKNLLRMFPIVYPFVNVEQILDCAREDNKKINLGPLKNFIVNLEKWNGVDKFSASRQDLQQIDLILENFELPMVTKHEDLLNKLVLVCADKYPQAQNWRNLLDRQKLMSEIDQTHATAVRKM